VLKSRVLLPSDGSGTSMKAAAYAARLMKINPEIKLTVLVVAPGSGGFGEVNEEEKELFEKIDSAMEARARDILEKTMSVFQKEGLKVEGVVEKGDPAGVIVEYAGRGDYDHIIMGSRGVSELRTGVLGSVSHKVVQLADCRVTLVK